MAKKLMVTGWWDDRPEPGEENRHEPRVPFDGRHLAVAAVHGRLQETLRIIESGRLFDRAQLALMCGYFDQAHFVHDFREFSGLNPGSYRAHRGEHANHVVVLGD